MMWELKVADILQGVLAAGSARDWDRMIELAKELEELARSQKAILDPGADECPGNGHPDGNPG
ncbi:hypothetical protein ES703_73488 [subsurface metagenome]